jgi:hypothetical protein
VFFVKRTNVYFQAAGGECSLAASCFNHADSEKAAQMLNRALKLDAERKYTAAARLIAEVECFAGFEWADL